MADTPGADGFQIASAFVNVEPDAEGFQEALEAQIGDTGLVVNIPVVPDAEDFKAQVDAAVAESDATVTVPVEPDTADFKAKVESAVAGSETPVSVPVEPDAAGFAEKVETETAASGAKVAVPVEPEMADFAAKTEAEAEAAGAASGQTFGEKFSNVAAQAPLFAGAEQNLERDAETAASGSATGFGDRFKSLLSGIPLFSGATPGIESEAATAAEESGSGFASKFKGILAGTPMLAGLIPGMESEAATAGESAGESFGGKFKAAVLGDMSLMEAALGAGAIAAAATLASKFESAMTMISTQAGVAKSALAGLSSGVLALAGQVGFSPDSLAEALYHIESSFASTGISGQKALDMLKTAAEGAATGHAHLVDVTNALDAAIASGIPGVQNMKSAMGALNAIVGAGDMKMQDLAEAFGTGMLATVKGFGVTLNDVGAALATFGDNNIRGAKAGNQLRMAIQALGAPGTGDVAKAALDKLDLSYTQLSTDMQHGGLKLAIQDLITHMNNAGVTGDKVGEMLTDAFGKKAGAGINILVGQVQRFESKYPDMEKGASGFSSAWAQASATTSQKLKDLEAGLESLVTRIGMGLLPSISHFLSMVNQALPSIEHFGEAIAHLVAPVVSSFFTGLGAILKLLFGPLKDITLGVGALALAWVGLNAIMDLNPFVAIAAAIITLVGVVIKYHKQIVDAIEDAWNAVLNFVKQWWPLLLAVVTGGISLIVDVIIKYHQQISDAITTAWNAIYSFISGIIDKITSFLSDSWNTIKSDVTTAWDGISAFFTQWWDTLTSAFRTAYTTIANDLKNEWATVKNDVTTAWDAISTWFSQWWNTLTSAFKTAYTAIATALKNEWTTIKNDVTTAWDAISTWFSQWWTKLTNAFKTAYTLVANNLKAEWTTIKNDITTAWNAIYNTFSSFWTKIEKGFTDAVSAIGTAWGKLESLFKTPVSFLVNTVYDNGIAKLWNDVAAKIPGIPTLPTFSFARGGRVTQGTGPTSDDVLARVSKGETVVSAEHSKTLAPAFKAVGVPGYAAGGIPNPIGGALGVVKSLVGETYDDIVDVSKIVAAVATGNTGALQNALDKFIKTSATGDVGAIMTDVPKTLVADAVHGVVSALVKAVSGGPGGGVSSPVGAASAGVAQWKSDILKVFSMLHIPDSDLGVVEAQMQTESGGNPNAINLWDSNAAAGDPSRGLMQVIMSTFNAYRSPSLSNNIYDPLANIYAGLNYAMKTYGSGWTSVLGQGHGYADGGIIGEPILGVGQSGRMYSFGEIGPETVTPGVGGRDGIVVNFNGVAFPSPEQVQAMKMALASAVGVAG